MKIVKMMMVRRGAWGSKGQCAQSVRVSPGDLTAGCHRVAPFLFTLPSTHQCCRLRTTPPHPWVSPSCENLAVYLHEGQPTFPLIAPKAPTYPAELKPWPQDPSGSGPTSDSVWSLFLLLCCGHMGFLTAPNMCRSCSCLRAFALAVPSAWSVLFHMYTWLMLSLIAFKYHHLIKCHLLREAFSDHLS